MKGACFENLTWDKKVPNGVFISFEPKDEKLIELLERRKKLNSSNFTIYLTKRYRKQRSEEEFLEFLKKQETKKAPKQ